MKARRQKQLQLFPKPKPEYGGKFRNTRENRRRPRPLSITETMHLVLRSSRATGKWSFKHAGNEGMLRKEVKHFAAKNGVRVLTMANVGNHLHLQLKLGNKQLYRAFIRALTGVIAMRVTGTGKGAALKKDPESGQKRFWDLRPFTRIVKGRKAELTLRDYITVNQLEGFGCKRENARILLREGIVYLDGS